MEEGRIIKRGNKDMEKVCVDSFSGLTMDYVRQKRL